MHVFNIYRNRHAQWRLLATLSLAIMLSACRSSPLTNIASADDELFLPAVDETFEQHVDRVTDYLAANRLSNRTDQAVALNAPFALAANPDVPFRGRFLLFHGLNDSAYVWRDIATELAARGFAVRAVLFAGHGSTPVNMLNVSHKSWTMAAREHLLRWQTADVPMYLGGFSMGAVIATQMALQVDGIDGLLLISPAYRSRLNHYLRFSGIYKLFRPWVFGGMIHEDNPMKYNSIPVNSGWQFFRLTQQLAHGWGSRRLTIPTLMVATADDSVVDTDFTMRVFNKRFTHEKSRFVVYGGVDDVPASTQPSTARPPAARPNAAQPNAAQSPAARPLAARPNSALESKIDWRSAAAPDFRIINQSHLGLMYAPGNPLFGAGGQVLVCNGNEYPIYIACMRANEHWYGAQHTPSPDGTPVARTTFNPDFDFVLQRLDLVFAP